MIRAIAPCLLLVMAFQLRAENGVRAGAFTIETPTLICLGFDWEISGDDNRNATVDVQYRRSGAPEWKQALPLLRIGGERVFRATENLDYTVPDRFAGSIFDLEPDAEYEVRLTMRDTDGVAGTAVQNTKVRTRGEPRLRRAAAPCTSIRWTGRVQSRSPRSPD
jgi:hypothetical protein